VWWPSISTSPTAGPRISNWTSCHGGRLPYADATFDLAVSLLVQPFETATVGAQLSADVGARGPTRLEDDEITPAQFGGSGGQL